MERANNFPVVFLISGNGSNLQAIINATRSSLLPIDIKIVISSNEKAFGLQRANEAGIAHHAILPTHFPDRTAYDHALAEYVNQFSPRLIVLAGFMRILTPSFLSKFPNKIINIHPSLLPKYPGLNTHELVLKEGAFEHGCSIHFVNENLDAGPVIAQAKVKVKVDDTIESLKNRVHIAEHFLYPTVINWFANNRVELKNNKVWIDNTPLPKYGLRFDIYGL